MHVCHRTQQHSPPHAPSTKAGRNGCYISPVIAHLRSGNSKRGVLACQSHMNPLLASASCNVAENALEELLFKSVLASHVLLVPQHATSQVWTVDEARVHRCGAEGGSCEVGGGEVGGNLDSAAKRSMQWHGMVTTLVTTVHLTPASTQH